MSRLFLPRHARTHRRGGSDPLVEELDATTASWAIMADYQAMDQDADTFTFATPFFLTNNAEMFEKRSDSGVPSFDGIQVLQAGIYEVTWAINASFTGTPASADAIRMTVIDGASPTDTHFFQIDDGDVNNYGTNNGFVASWNVSSNGLIGFEGDAPTADNYITIGWTYTGGDSADIDGRGVMYLKRLGDFVEGFVAF